MQKRMVYLLLALCLVFWVGRAEAGVEAEDVKNIQSSGSPIDTALSGDGQLLFVLTNQGKVEIYTKHGQFIDAIELKAPADRITSSAEGEMIYLSDSASGQIKMVAVDFIQKIDIVGSPYKGVAEAPVAVAIFSDFQ